MRGNMDESNWASRMQTKGYARQFGNRFGVTLLETIVVLAIIAVLLALLFPAVQRARNAAQDSVCKNNLHQLVLAVEHYRSATKKLPAPEQPNTVSGWAIDILPFLEERGLADQLAGFPSINQPSILPHISHRPRIMTCPFGWEGDSSLPGIPASHYVFNGFAIGDVPLSSRIPWPTSPQMDLWSLPRDEGPHSGGYYIAQFGETSVSGNVQWFSGK
jgi:prepilin-type N-terminal cleavage/methylation domain-containing protein